VLAGEATPGVKEYWEQLKYNPPKSLADALVPVKKSMLTWHAKLNKLERI